MSWPAAAFSHLSGPSDEAGRGVCKQGRVMSGKWYYVSDSDPNDGCMGVIFIIIVLMLIRGCRHGVAEIVARWTCLPTL